MAGSERRSLSLRVLRASLVAAVVVGAAAACGSSGTNRRGGPLADPAAVQDPPGNPAAALLNGEVPLPNPEQPPAPAEAPPSNPEQPSSPSGGGGPATGMVAGGGCPQVCVGLGGVCGSACLTSCGDLSAVSSCAALVSSLLDCVGRATLVCGPNGKINFANVNSCEDEGRAAVDCVMNIQNDTLPPVPGRGPPGN